MCNVYRVTKTQVKVKKQTDNHNRSSLKTVLSRVENSESLKSEHEISVLGFSGSLFVMWRHFGFKPDGDKQYSFWAKFAIVL